MRAAWNPSPLRTPSSRCRVVCGFALTIDSFCPSRALSSVDLPTFALPTIATSPLRKLVVRPVTFQGYSLLGAGDLGRPFCV